jgi:AcrR family transcriptional regulator
MPAKRKPERKSDVLNAMADYLLGSGVAQASLRPVAAAAGLSPRMMLYHYSTKEELLVAALREVRRRETAMLMREIGGERGPRSPDDFMRRVWHWYASPAREPYLQVFFEAWGMSLRRPFLRSGFLDHVRKDFLTMAESVLEARGYDKRDASAIATILIAAFRGMLIDLVANPRDRARLADATEIFIRIMGLMSTGMAPSAGRLLGDGPAPSAPARARRRHARPRATGTSRRAGDS